MRRIGFAIFEFGVLVEPAIGGGDGGTILFIERAVKLVGAALGDESDLPTRGAPLVGIVADRCDAKFFDRVERGADGTLEGRAADLVIVIDAVEGDVGLVAAPAVE